MRNILSTNITSPLFRSVTSVSRWLIFLSLTALTIPAYAQFGGLLDNVTKSAEDSVKASAKSLEDSAKKTVEDTQKQLEDSANKAVDDAKKQVEATQKQLEDQANKAVNDAKKQVDDAQKNLERQVQETQQRAINAATQPLNDATRSVNESIQKNTRGLVPGVRLDTGNSGNQSQPAASTNSNQTQPTGNADNRSTAAGNKRGNSRTTDDSGTVRGDNRRPTSTRSTGSNSGGNAGNSTAAETETETATETDEPIDATGFGDADVAGFVDPIIRRSMQRHNTPGSVVCLVQNGRVYFLRGYGYADVADRVQADPWRLRFPVGQISSVFTAAAILQSRDRGLLELNTPARYYLRETLPRYDGRRITIEHLLERRTGFAPLRDNGGVENRNLLKSLSDYVYERRPRLNSRDTGPSDYEIGVLGYILERKYQSSFADHMRRSFLYPLGMRNSTFDHLEDDDRTAKSYRFSNGSYTKLPELYYSPAPALGLRTSAGDMARFMAMLLDDGLLGTVRILNPDSIRRMLPPSEAGTERRFAYGLEPFQRGRARGYIRRGSLSGYAAVMVLLPERKAGIFIAQNNYAPDMYETVMRSVIDEFFQ